MKADHLNYSKKGTANAATVDSYDPNNPLYDYLDVVDNVRDYGGLDDDDPNEDGAYYQVVECDCDDDDVIRINGNNDGFHYSNISFSGKTFGNYYRTNYFKKSQKINYFNAKHNKMNFENGYSRNHVENDHPNKGGTHNGSLRHPVLNDNYYNNNHSMDYKLWQRRHNKKGMRRLKIDMERNIQNGMRRKFMNYDLYFTIWNSNECLCAWILFSSTMYNNT